MEDPLKPKTVPLAAETILWFEFLLDPSLLTAHLSKSNPDPTPIDLISQFISMSPDQQIIQFDLTGIGPEIEPVTMPAPPTPTATDGLKIAKKQLALKILTLKVSTFLKWNLDIIEKHLPIQKQLYLLRDLCTIAFGKIVNIPLSVDFSCTPTPEGSEKAVKFALTLYHRWVLRLQILKDIAIKTVRPLMHMMIPAEQPIPIIAPEVSTQPSVDYLTELCSIDEPFYIFAYDSFVALHPNSEKTTQNFDSMRKISDTELKAQIHFDLVGFYLYSKQYTLARQSAIECQKHLRNLKNDYSRIGLNEFAYCHIDDDEFEGYLLACGISDTPVRLLEKLNMSLINQYKGIVEIFKLDNKAREIPLVTRRIIELDVEGAISHGLLNVPKETEVRLAALNVIRGIFEEGDIFSGVDFFDKYKTMDSFPALLEGLTDILPNCSLSEKNKIREFLIDCVLKINDGKKLLKQLESLGLFSGIEIEDLKRQVNDADIHVPPLGTQVDWKWSSKILRIEVGALERQLISCTNATAVRKLLVKLAATNPSKPLWTVNPSWQVPTPINSLLMSLQRGFLQDFAYVLLGKAREMAAKNDFVGAVSMLSVLKSETQRPELSNATPISKLGKLVTWEILHIQLCQCLDEWNKKTLDLQSLTTRCKQCLTSLQGGDNVIPRIEIVENCAIMLLNLNDWNALMFLDNKRPPTLDLPVAFASTFIEMKKLKGGKKICRDAWDLVLVMFSNTTNKRPGTGIGNNRNSPSLVISSSLYPFLKRIRDPLVFSLVISLLAKIHNILKDDPNFDLNGEYMFLWPASISNPIGYNIRAVSEILNWLLKEALNYYPQNINWLKIKGDLELAIGNNEAAMRCYVNALITGTEYCNLPLQRHVIDDYIIRKMIKCSSNLGCYMQAAVLCQFLDEIDYGLAFKNISEKSSGFTDAMDAYYSCIWDPTLLEFIVNLHSKKGEHNRKLEVIAIMSSLELNANNNDEIKREAATIRKTRFLRALAKQYLL